MTQVRPTLLHHYTSLVGLAGIVNTKSLWATSVDELNDTSELHLAEERLALALRSRADELPPTPESLRGEEYRRMPGKPENLVGIADWVSRGDNRPPCFVTSFTELEDDFGMWMKFSAQVCMSFSSSKLLVGGAPAASGELDGEAIGDAGWFEPTLMKVRYLRDGDQQHAATIVREVVDRIVLSPPPSRDVYSALMGLASIKDAVFSSDEEWRLFYSLSHEPGIGGPSFYPRVSAGGKHFIERPIGLDSVAFVTVAPGPGAGQLHEIAANIINARGMTAVLRHSRVPLRFAQH